ncbi:MAG: hypothetical protein R6T83_08410 [Salinibacter sp.]
MILTYYPDIDTLDVDFHIPDGEKFDSLQEARDTAQEVVSRTRIPQEGSETYDADPTGQTHAHYRDDKLAGLTIEHASVRAPEAWNIPSLRKEAAKVAASTGRIVERITYDLLSNRKSIHQGGLGPQSPHTSDEAVQEFNEMIDEIEAASAAA